ncbi:MULTISPECIES: helix-turn-helix domain-containing protein [unclassified Nocardioides]|uniref:PucR family transcriptional regulator n=1 Tax=unclassified Nocardioides TaxID=2615069 RepID=UPI0000EB6314|nr:MULTISPECIES: helix-turn-helix domain-containing protein [unclassified Nocardioides]ABL83773.1 transcriptional regulator, CdaR family [Nocardioides sp. JS614]
MSDPHGEVTLERLLDERLLQGAVLVAGADPGVAVRWCHSLADLEDPPRDLDLVAVMARPEQLTATVLQRLVAAGAAAVFVLASSEADRSPPAVPGLNVVVVPPGVPPRALAELVARLGLAHESHVLQYAQRVHSALAQLLHRGAGVSALCTRMSRLSNCSVAVIATDLRILAFDQGPNPWMHASMVAATVRELHERLLQEDVSAGPVTLETSIGDNEVVCVVGAIELADHREGWIAVINADDSPHGHDLAEHRVVVEQAATIVGTELLRLRSVERAEERARGNFVHALLHGRFSNHADLVARASHHDFAVEGRYGVVIARSAGLIAERDAPVRLAEMAREALRVAPVDDRQTLTAVVGDVLAVVRQVSPAGRTHPDPTAHELRDYATGLERRLARLLQRPVHVAYGRPVKGAEQIVLSYREARIALDLGERLRMERVCGFADLRVDSALLGLAREPAGKSFFTDVLEPLRQDRSGTLLDVAREYVAAGGNVNESARRLGIHRNTMLYKLDRISRLLERDIREADTQFTIWLALRLSTLAATAELVDRDVSSG